MNPVLTLISSSSCLLLPFVILRVTRVFSVAVSCWSRSVSLARVWLSADRTLAGSRVCCRMISCNFSSSSWESLWDGGVGVTDTLTEGRLVKLHYLDNITIDMLQFHYGSFIIIVTVSLELGLSRLCQLTGIFSPFVLDQLETLHNYIIILKRTFIIMHSHLCLLV